MKEIIYNNFHSFSKEHGVDGAIVIISSETLLTIYGGALLLELRLYYLIAPLAFLPLSLISTLPLYLIIKKVLKKHKVRKMKFAHNEIYEDANTEKIQSLSESI